MTDIVPISTDVFNIPKQLLNHLDIVAGLDCGVCLTKIVYVPKKLVNYDDESNTIILATALFDSKDVLDAIEFLKNEACLPETGVLHVTGTIETSTKKAIFDKLGLHTFYFDEFESHLRGTKFLVNTLKLEDIAFTPVKEKSYGVVKMRLHDQMKKLQEEKEKSTDAETNDKPSSHWPAVYVNIGATTTVGLIMENGTYGCLSSRVMAGGKTLRGLAQILTGTSDYNEIMSLAESGDRCKVDTQIKDIIDDDPNSPYGKFPPELPTFMFGKAAETGSSEVNYAKEDMAASFISLICSNIYGALYGLTPWITNSKVYFSGCTVFSKLFRMEMEYCSSVKRDFLKYDNIYMKTSHTAAVGAMITTTNID